MPRPSTTSQSMQRRRAVAVLVALVGTLLALPASPARASYDLSELTWLHDYTEPDYGVPDDFRGVGDSAGFRFADEDLDPDVSSLSVVASSTSDPIGILVVAEREARSSSSYTGRFRFSTQSSDPLGAVLEVQDGDTVSVTYREPRDAQGLPREHVLSRTWFAATRAPDLNRLGFVRPPGEPAVVRGPAGAVPANSLVRLFGSGEADAAVATGTADSEGRFRIATDAELATTVAVSAQEPGLPESERVPVHQAWVTGRVVLPDSGLGVHSALIELRAEGDPDPCGGRENCSAGPWLTDADGQFHAYPAAGPFDATPGRYDVFVEHQTVPDGAPWYSSAYGHNGPFGMTLGDGTTTVDVGDLALVAPNVFGEVRDSAGVAVDEADIEVRDAGGEFVANTYSRRDGAFALRLPDGDHQLRVRSLFRCVTYAETTATVSVRDGIATPAHLDIVMHPVGVNPEGWSVPLHPPANGMVVGLGGPGLTLRLDGASGPGTLSVRCAGDGWDGVSAISPPVEIDWDSGFEKADVCLRYEPERAQQAGLTPGELQVLHRGDDGHLTALPLQPGTLENQLCGETESFSSFAIGTLAATPPAPGPPAPTTPQARATDDSCPPWVPEDGFTDLPEGAAHEAAVDCIVWWRLAQGRTAQSYAPTSDVTRAQMATFIANLVTASGGSLPPARVDHFDDDDGDRHEDSINRLAEAGIVAGQLDGGYGPLLPVRRDQMAAFLVRATERRTGVPLPRHGDFFADDDGTTHEVRIDQAASAGFTGGGADGGYAPALPVRRDQMGSFLARVLDLLVEQHGARLP